MIASLEITLYPLGPDPNDTVQYFIDQLSGYKNLEIETNKLSTIITGNYDDLFEFLNLECKKLFEKSPASFVIKHSNTCGCQL